MVPLPLLHLKLIATMFEVIDMESKVWNVKVVRGKDLSLKERPALYQLVGEVTAHQGYDA